VSQANEGAAIIDIIFFVFFFGSLLFFQTVGLKNFAWNRNFKKSPSTRATLYFARQRFEHDFEGDPTLLFLVFLLFNYSINFIFLSNWNCN
jgi:hypothetical protein